jgi:hypothetical protein
MGMETFIGLLNDTCTGLLAVLTIKKQGISKRLIGSDGRDKLGSNLSIIVKVLTVHFDGWKALPIIHSQLVLPIIERKQVGQSQLTLPMIQIVVTRLNTKRIIQMKVTTVRIKCRPTFMCTTINTRCMGAAVMGGRDAERVGCVADKVMRWTSGRRKHFHSVVESKA